MLVRVHINQFFDEFVIIDIPILPRKGELFFLHQNKKEELEKKLWNISKNKTYKELRQELKDGFNQIKDINKKVNRNHFDICDHFYIDDITYYQHDGKNTLTIYMSLST